MGWALSITMVIAPASTSAQWALSPESPVSIHSPTSTANPASPSSTDAARRVARARTLGRSRDRARAAAEAAALLEGERRLPVQIELVTSLARLAHPDAVDALTSALAEPRLRGMAAIALGETARAGDVRAANVLAEHGAVAGYQQDVREGLRRAGGVAVSALSRALRDGGPNLIVALTSAADLRTHELAPSVAEVAMGTATPPQRAAALRALGEIGDSRYASVVDDVLRRAEEPSVLRAALEAAAALGAPGSADAIRPHLQRPEPELRIAAIEAMLRCAPEEGSVALTEAVASSSATTVRDAAELALAWGDPRAVAILYGLINEGTRAEEAISALAELGTPEGLAVLLRVADESGAHGESARRGLAVALRRHGDRLPRRLFTEAMRRVRAASEMNALVFRALAGDTTALEDGLELLASSEPLDRLRGAQALGALGSLAGERALNALVLAAISEESPDAFLTFVSVALRLPGNCTLPAPLRFPSPSPLMERHALLLGARCIQGATPSRRRDLGVRARRALRDRSADVRAEGAWALALLEDHAATRTLLRHLERERDEHARRAMARAIAVLSTDRTREDVERTARTLAESELSTWLRRGAGRDRGPEDFGIAGTEILRVALRAPDLRPEGLSVRVRLPDGRTLRMKTLPNGLVVIPDLPAGEADVEVVEEPAAPGTE